MSNSSNNQSPENPWQFVGLSFLLAGFSLYLITSYFNSTSEYINSMQASVISADKIVVVEKGEPYPVFSDVQSNQAFGEAIAYLRDQGVVSGYEDGSFRPKDSVSRATLAVLLVTAAKADLADGEYRNCFGDLGDEWFAAHVCYAVEHGWMGGDEGNNFRPAEMVSRAVALKVILTAFGYEVPEAATGQAWHVPYFAEGERLGLVNAAALFTADQMISRGELAEMIYRALKK